MGLLKSLAEWVGNGSGFATQPHCEKEESDTRAGIVDLDKLASVIDDRTALVSIMLANNEMGAVQPLRQISELCEKYGVLLHTDATQAVGKLPVNVVDLGVDLLSFSAHKFYGPKGVGGLIVSQNRNFVELFASDRWGRAAAESSVGTQTVRYRRYGGCPANLC